MIRYKNALFVHVPKAGGSWVRTVLKQGGGKDVSYAHDIPANNRFYLLTRRVQPFCFVRHPLEFVYSIWRHWSGNPKCRINNANPAKAFMWDKRLTGTFYCDCIVENDLEKTIANFTEKWPGFVTWLYAQFTRDCVYIGRHERLKDDFERALLLINGGIDPDLKALIRDKERINVSEGREAMVPEDLARRFLDQEPFAKIWGYESMPDFVVRK